MSSQGSALPPSFPLFASLWCFIPTVYWHLAVTRTVPVGRNKFPLPSHPSSWCDAVWLIPPNQVVAVWGFPIPRNWIFQQLPETHKCYCHLGQGSGCVPQRTHGGCSGNGVGGCGTIKTQILLSPKTSSPGPTRSWGSLEICEGGIGNLLLTKHGHGWWLSYVVQLYVIGFQPLLSTSLKANQKGSLQENRVQTQFINAFFIHH